MSVEVSIILGIGIMVAVILVEILATIHDTRGTIFGEVRKDIIPADEIIESRQNNEIKVESLPIREKKVQRQIVILNPILEKLRNPKKTYVLVDIPTKLNVAERKHLIKMIEEKGYVIDTYSWSTMWEISLPKDEIKAGE